MVRIFSREWYSLNQSKKGKIRALEREKTLKSPVETKVGSYGEKISKTVQKRRNSAIKRSIYT